MEWRGYVISELDGWIGGLVALVLLGRRRRKEQTETETEETRLELHAGCFFFSLQMETGIQ